MDQVRENGATSGVGLLADYAYDPLSRRTGITRAGGGGAATTFAFDNASRLTQLIQNLGGGTTNDQTLGFGYSPASQITSRTASNDLYGWTTAAFDFDYSRNGLNQYTSVSGTTYSHDARGNLTSDGARLFCYDLENRLTGVASAGGNACTSPTFAVAYDPLGRMQQTTQGSIVTQFLYDGDRLVAEYDGTGVLQRRYVHGGGIDEPSAWYQGAALDAASRRWLHADHQGSIIASSDGGGALSGSRYSYGPYGEPDPANGWSGQRFRYTGQIALPEAQLYYYKARVYDPRLGRFPQTDPVGYEPDLNLYTYVHADPINRVDPSGLSDLNFFNSDWWGLNKQHSFYAASEAFDAPGFFTITGHAATVGFRDDRERYKGPMLAADRLLLAARAGGLQRGEPILLAGCNLSDAFAQYVANANRSDVYAPNGFVMYPTSEEIGPASAPFTLSVKRRSGEAGEWRRFTPDGIGPSGPDISGITVDPRTGMATVRYRPDPRSVQRLGRTVTACIDKDKCGERR